jgi:hypothetical protein
MIMLADIDAATGHERARGALGASGYGHLGGHPAAVMTLAAGLP